MGRRLRAIFSKTTTTGMEEQRAKDVVFFSRGQDQHGSRSSMSLSNTKAQVLKPLLATLCKGR
eukprot:11447354-Prorocentrum_lima.AAC.1